MECPDPHTPKMFLSLKAGLLLMLNSQICIGMYSDWGCCETRSQFGPSRRKSEGDMASLCIHGITSNLMSKRYGREPSACAVREPKSELISLQQWLDLSNINAQACLSCHHFELASPWESIRKDSPVGAMASTQTLPVTTSLSKIAIPSRLFSSHQIRMPHQNILATGHQAWGSKKKLPLPTITLLPSFSIASREKEFLLRVIDPSTTGENNNNNKQPDGRD